MTSNLRTVVWDAATVYGLTFAFGLGTALAGLNLQSHPSTAYLINLLSGALGFTAAGVRISADRIEHLAWVAATVWTFNLTNIALGIQTTSAWINSGLTVLLMAAIGGSLSAILPLASQPPRRHTGLPPTK
jgi:hypothetical protein